MLTMTVAAGAALECVAGRLAAMHLREHRLGLMLGYLLAAGVCIMAASMVWQRLDVRWLDLASWGIAAHLVLTWRNWRHGAPPDTLRQDYYPRGAMPSRIDDSGR
jgi:hypothetical protein